jgi:fatty-acyl-CoA synthase
MADSRRLSYAYTGSKTPLLGLTIPDLLDQTTARFPGNEALVDVPSGRRWTYREFREICRRAARSFMGLGVKSGDRVGIWATNYPEWVIVQFSTAMIGAVLVNINPAYRAHELEHALVDSEAGSLVLIERFKTSDYIAMFGEVCPEIKDSKPGRLNAKSLPTLRNVVLIGDSSHPGMFTWSEFMRLGEEVSEEELMQRQQHLDFDDVINIQYTSGTTGLPKGASLTHHNILNNGYFAGEGLGLTDRDRLCIPVPFYHCFGMVLSNLACVTHGATMVVPSESFDALATLQAVERERCTALHGVPTMFIAEMEHPQFGQFDLSSLRTGLMAGAPCPVEVMRKVIDLMHASEIAIAYGETEASPVATQTPADASLEDRTSTVGPPLPFVETKIVDGNTGRVVPCGEQGEICYRGYNIMRGYYNNPQGTAEVIDEAGWLHSGDLATMDERGYCRITGRAKEMVIRGGENIYPREIEEFLFTHPKVKNVQVIGVPDKKYGEELQAWIQLKEGESATPEEIREFCKGGIAHYKIPRYIKFVAGFPMTVTGKIQKFKMRQTAVKELGLEAETKTETA